MSAGSAGRLVRSFLIKKTAFPEGNRKAAMETGKLFADRDSLLSILTGGNTLFNGNFGN